MFESQQQKKNSFMQVDEFGSWEDSSASRVHLPSSVMWKMSHSFGTDFSGVQFYESQKVAEAGARALAFGNQVAFAPGQFRPGSSEGQNLIGHELSHVVQQTNGQVASPQKKGFSVIENDALERQADEEGKKAAKGEKIFPLSEGLKGKTTVSMETIEAPALKPMGQGMQGAAGIQLSRASDKEERQRRRQDRRNQRNVAAYNDAFQMGNFYSAYPGMPYGHAYNDDTSTETEIGDWLSMSRKQRRRRAAQMQSMMHEFG